MNTIATLFRWGALCAALVSSWPLGAQPLTVPVPVRVEVEALLERLQSSGCAFERNGTRHTAAEAREHLLNKLAYLERRNAVQSTEAFIEQGASRSSSSGKAYRVLCAGVPASESGTWLRAELQRMRAASKASATGH